MFFKKKAAAPIEEPKDDTLRCGQCKECGARKGGLYCKRTLKEVQKGERSIIVTVTKETKCIYEGMN
jgi:hypothetical protein